MSGRQAPAEVWPDGYPPPNAGEWAGPEHETSGMRDVYEPPRGHLGEKWATSRNALDNIRTNPRSKT